MFSISRSSLSLRKPRMLSSQSLQQLLNRFRKTLISHHLGSPSCISASCRKRKEREDSDSGSLVLIRHIRVITGCCQASGASLGTVLVVGSEVDVVEFNVVLDVGSYWVDVKLSEVLPELFLFRRADVLEVLTAENDDASLSDQQSELILLGIAELAELQAFDLGTDSGS